MQPGIGKMYMYKMYMQGSLSKKHCVSNPVEKPLAFTDSDSARSYLQTRSVLDRLNYNSEEASTGYFWVFSFANSVVKWYKQVKNTLVLDCVQHLLPTFNYHSTRYGFSIAIYLNYHLLLLISAFVKISYGVSMGKHLMVTFCQL